MIRNGDGGGDLRGLEGDEDDQDHSRYRLVKWLLLLLSPSIEFEILFGKVIIRHSSSG